jgi:hypothetical protein
MPPDDSRPSRLAPAAAWDDGELDPCPIPDDDDGDPNQTPERFAAVDPTFLAELRQQAKDIDEGRSEPGIPLEEFLVEWFAPLTPEELAEDEEDRVRRARR